MALHGRILSLKQDSTHLHYKATWPASASLPPGPRRAGAVKQGDQVLVDTEELVKHYFSLRHNATALYDQWSEADPNFRQKAPKFTGIRILSQDAWETLVGFICSSNNNISRISQMVFKLCQHYGPLVGHVGEEAFYDFPSPASLMGKSVESHLRELGFGYRAKYIAETARIVLEDKPQGWLQGLTNQENLGWGAGGEQKLSHFSYKEVHEQLLGLSGVGPKVADCVCLMGLGWGEAVPVDTHVWQIAQRDYKFGTVKTKTFSKRMYDSVGDHFRKIWGRQAGWAQSVLFTANLKSFSDRIASSGADADGVKAEAEAEAKQDALGELPTLPSKRKRAPTVAPVKLEVVPGTDTQATHKRRRIKS